MISGQARSRRGILFAFRDWTGLLKPSGLRLLKRLSVKRKRILLCGIIVAVCASLYVKSLRYPFVNWDDYPLITQNPYITQLSLQNIKDIFTPGVVGAYQPIRTLTYSIDYRLWGLNPLGYHITNLLFYTLTCILVFNFINVFLRNDKLALWGGLFFAMHPLHVEAVAWLSARKETLTGFFFLLTFILYVKSIRSGKRYYWGSVLCFILALLSKPTAVVLPALLILYDLCFVAEQSFRKLIGRIKYYVPYVLLSGGLTYITIVLSSKGGVLKPFHGGTLYTQIITSLTVFIKGIRLLVFPVNLSPRYTDYSYASLREPEALLAALSLALLVFLAWDFWKRSPVAFFCILWYPITFLPVSNIIPISTLMADRYFFLPSVGIALLFAACVSQIGRLRNLRGLKRIARPAIVAACGALLFFFAVQTFGRNQIWKNSISLWTDAVRQDSLNVMGHYALGNVYMEAGLHDDAIKSYRNAIALVPSFSSAHAGLGNAYLAKGEVDRAIYHYQEAQSLGSAEDLAIFANLGMALEHKGLFEEAISQYERALEVDSTFAMARLGLAESYSRKGQYGRAIEEYNELIRIEERNLKARVFFNLGVAQHMKGNYSDAIASYEEALGMEPEFADAHYGMGNAHYKMGEYEAAVSDFSEAILLAPGHVAAIGNLGNVYFDMGMPDKAISQYKDALNLLPTSLILLNNLGLANVELRRFEEAIETFERVIELDSNGASGYTNLGYAYTRRGMFDEAFAQYKKAVSIDPKNAVAYYNMACAHSLRGEPAEGIKNLKKAVELGFSDVELIRSDPDLDGLRAEPGFNDLIDNL